MANVKLFWPVICITLLLTCRTFGAEKTNNPNRARSVSPAMEAVTPLPSSTSAYLFEDNFDGANDTTALKARGYKVHYRGAGPRGTAPIWFQGSPATFVAFNGPTNGYVASNFNSVTGANRIDNWLILPALPIASGDSIRFYERSVTANPFNDSLRVMYSVTGDSVPEGSWVQLGAPFLAEESGSWARKAFAAPASGEAARFAIRYRVEDGGPSGNNSNYIGIDALTVGDPPADDAQSLSLDSPADDGWVKSGTPFAPQATFKNVGTSTVTFSVTYEILSTAYVNTKTVTSLAAGGSQQVTFDSVAGGLAAGTYTVRAVSLLGGDINASNDTVSGTITSEIAVSSYPYVQDFEATLETDEGWAGKIVSGSVNEWVRGTPVKAAQIDGAHGGVKCWVTRLDSNYAVDQNAALVSPLFDMSSLSGSPTLSFWHNFKTETGWDSGVLEYSIDGGASWRRVDSTLGTGGDFNTANSSRWCNSSSALECPPGPRPPKWSNTSSVYTSNDSGYINSVTSLAAVAGQASVKFRWHFFSDASVVAEGWAVDDVSLDPDPSTGVKSPGLDGIPGEYALYQNYPNPFNPSTNIRFGLPVQSGVIAEIYNTLGQRVKVLINDQRQPGYHRVEWNGTGNSGQTLGSGVYFVRLTANGSDGRTFTDVRKLTLLK